MSSRPARLPTWFKILIATLAALAAARGVALVEHTPLLALANNHDQIRYTACLDLAPWRPGVQADANSPQAPLSRFAFQPLPEGTCGVGVTVAMVRPTRGEIRPRGRAGGTGRRRARTCGADR